ncbi:ATPase family AAA domain-containing protein 5 [Pseudocercospora fuligena]|uniref:ATPase family AAA domain-containing protein 5 n=1 Tax=Pseudocercospora fuligena TaxID=685502 RepID=A0A8H6RED9_9PEZI|nr:ATPase family AAA domain-containing protein 5 [Pseudocercospora fuligena]
MAAVSVLPAMSAESEKSVHPFFKRTNGIHNERPHIRDEIPASESSEPLISEGPEIPDAEPKRAPSKRKVKSEQGEGKKKIQRTLSHIANPKGPIEESDVLDLATSEQNEDTTPRKRRRTSEHESIEVGAQDSGDAIVQVEQSSPVRQLEDRSSPQVIIPRSSPLPNATDAIVEPSDHVETNIPSDPILPSTPPKKLLRLNANGKFSSPPSKKPKDQPEPELEPPRRRGRPRRSAAANVKRELFAKFHYGSDDSSRTTLGERISRILAGEETAPVIIEADEPTSRKRASRRQATGKTTPKKASPKKPPHPFFNREKPKPQPALKLESPRKTSAVTPGKLRMQAMSERPNDARDIQPFGSALLKDRLMVKHPGARDAPFPDREQTHVRGLSSDHIAPPMDESTFDMLFSRRKRKQVRLPLLPQESILSQFALRLEPESDRVQRPDGFCEPSSRLKMPVRLVMSGQEIADRISSELSVPLQDEGIDELASTPSQGQSHPALGRMYARIPTILTAFDESKGEAYTWTQKHAPSSSADVLQPESEMVILKDWLNSLAVQSVEGAGLQIKAPVLKQEKQPKRKRKKKPDDLDDFLVDSDEDAHEMSEVTDPAHDSSIGARKSLKSIVQVAGDGAKLSNAVLLSGPHGCGKTAAAYAVAKELGFKVFEISSSERRSGKDVLDRIGDMTENHLVRHHGSEAGELSGPEEPSHIDEAFQKDLQSGRQGKMSAFFKATNKPAAKPKQPEPKKLVKEKAQKAVIEALKKPSKDQQQSLILLEEVDILFKDDKEFWTMILKLISTSKRPFIMTCNDEDLVPLQAMSLHAILRFRQPSLDLATDYMLLTAAAEGHLLKRNAVASLYQHHDQDLRASIMELDYWCQMGVGDPREGLGWIFQRWPPGSDLDAHGRKLRVVSDSTYAQGMGLTPAHDPTVEEAAWWAWIEFGIEPAAALGWTADSTDVEAIAPSDGTEAPRDDTQERKALMSHMRLAEALSAADACTGVALQVDGPFDATYPDMPDKARGHYIEGMALLQTDELVDHSEMSRHLRVCLTTSAYKCYGESRKRLEPNNLLGSIPKSITTATHELTRHSFACFDAISSPAEISLMNPGLQQSAFDGPLNTITQDLAPYVRSIVQYDQALEEQRERLNLLTGDGRQAKRARTTRAARSALEGSQRSTTRRERWFTKDLDVQAVLNTAGRDWPKLENLAPTSLGEGSATEGADAPASSAE